MNMRAGWTIAGVVTARRELKSEKNKEWRGYTCTIGVIGMALEVNVTQDVYAKVAEGMEVEASGKFEVKGYDQRLICTAIAEAKAGKP